MSKFIYAALAILALVFVASVTFVSTQSQAVNPQDKARVEFVVQKGESLNSISDRLSQFGLIRSRFVFKTVIYRNNLASRIQAGYFSLSPSQSSSEIALSLTRAQMKSLLITIPEGLRHEEIANAVVDQLKAASFPNNFDPDKFIRQSESIEGTLFPDSYSFSEGVTTEDVITKMTNQFDFVTKNYQVTESQLKRAIILASLIEREAAKDSERPEIAGILNNRLDNSWPLQIDATVQYVVSTNRCRIRICDWWPDNLTKADLQTSSPFNTYAHPGLPPMPICNPGAESIKAALNPNQTQNWFYLHDPQGQIHYASTVEMHNKNVCTYLKKC
jgi:UPF0755 protein